MFRNEESHLSFATYTPSQSVAADRVTAFSINPFAAVPPPGDHPGTSGARLPGSPRPGPSSAPGNMQTPARIARHDRASRRSAPPRRAIRRPPAAELALHPQDVEHCRRTNRPLTSSEPSTRRSGSASRKLSEPFEAAAEVYAVAQNAVIKFLRRAHVPKNHRPSIDPDAREHSPWHRASPVPAESADFAARLSFQCRPASHRRVLALDHRRVPEAHDGVPDVLIQRPVIGQDQPGHLPQIKVQHFAEPLRIH